MARPRVVGEWPPQGVTFETERGSFVIPGDVLARADATGDDFEVRRTIAPSESVKASFSWRSTPAAE